MKLHEYALAWAFGLTMIILLKIATYYHMRRWLYGKGIAWQW